MQGIVLSCFGSTAPAARVALRAVLAHYHGAFPNALLRLACTSQRVRSALGLPSAGDAIRELTGAGADGVVVQHLLLVPGQMMTEAGVHETVAEGAPLLADQADEDDLVQRVLGQLRPGVPNLVALHGNGRNPHFNRLHGNLRERLAAHGLAVGTLEGEPGDGVVEGVRAAAQAAGGAYIIPLFLLPGGHVNEDLLGSGPGSWAQRLGVPVQAAPTLLEQPAVVERFIAHTRQALGPRGR